MWILFIFHSDDQFIEFKERVGGTQNFTKIRTAVLTGSNSCDFVLSKVCDYTPPHSITLPFLVLLFLLFCSVRWGNNRTSISEYFLKKPIR
jgi:hypothetical protein